MKRAMCVLALMAAALAVYAPGSSGKHLGTPHGCAPLKVPSHPWEQFLNGQEGATGSGWLLYWKGHGGSCKVSRNEARSIIDRGAVPSKLKKACDSEKVQTPGNWIEPFHTLTCHVVGPKKANYSFQVFVDPTSAIPVH
jgi:hypothetical protein